MNGTQKSRTPAVKYKGNRHAVSQFNEALDREELKPLVNHSSTASDALKSSIGASLSYRFQRTCSKSDKRQLQPLKHIVASFLAHNVDAIPQKVLSQFSWAQVKPVWEQVQSGLLDSLETFAKFASAFPEDMIDRKTLHASIIDLPRMLSAVITLLLQYTEESRGPGVTLPWFLHLDLSHSPVTTDLLLQLGTVPGLTVLKVNDANITTSIINHWCRSQAAGGFSSLRLLDLRTNSTGISDLSASVHKLCRFAALQMIRCDCIANSEVLSLEADQQAQKERWNSISSEPRATVQLLAHLGSHADRRPVVIASDDMLIDVPRARLELVVVNPSIPRSQGRACPSSVRKQKKLKRMARIGDQFLT